MNSSVKFVEPTEANPQFENKTLQELLDLRHSVSSELIFRLRPNISAEDRTTLSNEWDRFAGEGSSLWTTAARHVEIVDGAEDTADHFVSYNTDKSLAYAQFFIMLHRLPAMMKMSMSQQINQYKLFCTYEGSRYRVTGASRLGDIWLTADFDQDTGYQHRVLLSECSEFSDSP